MSLATSKIVISLLPNELNIGFTVNGDKQFINTVPLIYTFKSDEKQKLVFGLVDTLLLDTKTESYETYQILNNDFDVIVEDDIFEQFIDYLYTKVLRLGDWKVNSSVLAQSVLVFQHGIKQDNMSSFANKFRRLAFNLGLRFPIYQLDTDLVTSMYYSTNSSIEKTNMVFNLQESFSSANVYNNGVELYKQKSAMSGSYLNYQLIERGISSSVSKESSTKQWQDSYSWLTRCRGFMLNFFSLENGVESLETIKKYYNSEDETFLYFKDQYNSLKIDLEDLEKTKKEYLYDGFESATSVRSLINEAIENSLHLKIQLFNNKDDSSKAESKEKEPHVETSSDQNTTFVSYLKQEYPKKEKSYSYRIVTNTDAQYQTNINKIIVRIGSNMTVIPFYLHVVRHFLKEKLSQSGYNPSDYEVVIDEDSNSWDIINKFAINCDDKEVLLTLNKN